MDAPDRCPYPRPFPREFNSCPAYVPRRWAVHALDGRPLGAVWTCWHLGNGRAGSTGTYYPRCGLGDQQARVAWTELAGADQVAAYRTFREAVVEVDDMMIAAATSPIGDPHMPAGDVAAVTAARRTAIDLLLDELRSAAAHHADLLDGTGLVADDWVIVTEDVFEHERRNPGHPWQPSAHLMDRLTPAARRLVDALTAGADNSG